MWTKINKIDVVDMVIHIGKGNIVSYKMLMEYVNLWDYIRQPRRTSKLINIAGSKTLNLPILIGLAIHNDGNTQRELPYAKY